jgi:hypothetical protein
MRDNWTLTGTPINIFIRQKWDTWYISYLPS